MENPLNSPSHKRRGYPIIAKPSCCRLKVLEMRRERIGAQWLRGITLIGGFRTSHNSLTTTMVGSTGRRVGCALEFSVRLLTGIVPDPTQLSESDRKTDAENREKAAMRPAVSIKD